MALLRFSYRVILLVLHLILGISLAATVLPLINRQKRDAMVSWWSRWLMHCCAVKIIIRGQPVRQESVMWVANHVSWVDVFILNSVRNTIFVAKKEIRDWPIIGWLVAVVGTIFIERGNRNVVSAIAQQLQRLLTQNYCIGLFPEGTTSEGFGMLNIHHGLLSAPLQAKVQIQPVALVYRHNDQRSGLVAFVGEQTLVHNIWVLLSSRNISVTAHFLEPVTKNNQEVQASRTEVGEKIKQQIQAILEQD
ncbi:lysophospholipid acyltransferase family protein [Brackiella oedipodis]|uniref:lysophospholipid acyltransferase family protein n=1 Tax=Brackiella oedipodis TaxID=124225 RepID=UPI00048CC7E9|nr:lysophospholipid acyltransferase family protein [Brackiella oedipodis]